MGADQTGDIDGARNSWAEVAERQLLPLVSGCLLKRAVIFRHPIKCTTLTRLSDIDGQKDNSRASEPDRAHEVLRKNICETEEISELRHNALS